jgi:glucose-1-phosphate adenylyltransferase
MAKQQSRASSGRYVSRLTSGALAVVMAGGRGERLRDLTLHRCKPATPFGGKFRIIDFVLSNCVNSGIRQIFLMTQYKGQSLIQHVQRGWSYLRGEFGEFIDVVPAQQQVGMHVVPRHRRLRLPEPRPDPRAAAQARAGARRRSHLQDGLRPDDRLSRREGRRHHGRGGRGAARQLARLRRAVGHRMEPGHQIHREAGEPDTIPRRGPDIALASMGIYVFNARLLEKLLIAKMPG